MSIREKFGKWHIRFRMSGDRHEFSTGLDAIKQNENAAKNIEAEKRLEVSRGIISRPQAGKALLFHVAATEFLNWCHGVQYRAHPNSALRISGSFFSLLEYFGDRPVTDIEHIDVERYKTWRIEKYDVKDVTLANDLGALSLFLAYCIRAKWRPPNSNPLLGDGRVKRPSREDAVRIHVISEAEEKRYFAVATGAVADCAKFMLLQGARPEEVMSLRKDSYDRSTQTIRIIWGKTNAAKRTIHLLPESAAIIERRLKVKGREDSQWLFPSRHMQSDDDRHVVQLDHSHDSACERACLSFVVYDFRHTFATRMLIEAKVDMASLAAIMGHSNMTVLRKYVHPSAEHQAEAMKKYSATRSAGLKIVRKKIS